MDWVIGILSSIVTTATEYTTTSIKNHVKYLSNHEKNVQTVKDGAERLKDARTSVQHRVDAAKRNGEEIEGGVETWLSKAHTKIHEEVEKVLQDEEKAKRKCFFGFCPNPWTRYKHSRKAEEETKAVAELLEQSKFERVSYRLAPQAIKAAPIKGFEEFESRASVLKEITEALQDDSVAVIGVHGMGGIGKTTLVRDVAREVKEGKLFDSVVIATVTQTPDVEKIQNEIADSLGLKFDEQSTAGKAHRLKERLKKEKVLVVLDDIWAYLDIEKVGIPLRDEHEGCKLLLTSRELNVLLNAMDTRRNFKVGVLKDEEAWDLFKKMAGDCVESSGLRPTAKEVADECAGLPIAIVMVARFLRNKSLAEWKNALRELRRPASSNFPGISAAYSAIEWSYNYLKSKEVKQTFLLCCLIGHNGLIEDLVRYTAGLHLFRGVITMEEARHKVLTVIAHLKASCLLLDSYDDEHIGVHDVVWDAALNIASRDCDMLVLSDHEEWRDKEKMNKLSMISLRSPRIMAELPQEMECSSLYLFHMVRNGSVKIPPHFFRGTKSLKVLFLFGMQFPSLPESINYLTDLRMLCLRGCELEDITIIGELKKLEILNLARSSIKALPKETAELSRLKLLDLRRCSKLKIIPQNVMSRLSKLEELYMDRSFTEWEHADVGNERRNASLDELNGLRYLTTLYAHIPDAQMIPKHWSTETLNRFRILIGDCDGWEWFEEHRDSRILMLDRNINLGDGVKMLLRKAEYIYLEGLEGIKNVLEESNNGEDFSDLKRLHVENCVQVQYISMKKTEFQELRSIRLEDLPQLISFCSQEERSSSGSENLPLFGKQVVFHCLESLEFYSIKSKRIWYNQTCSWVSNLTKLIISGCGDLEHLLSPSLARSLLQLQRFEINGCECLREIIFTEEIEEESKEMICFPQLNSLHLTGLKNLIMFCSRNYNVQFPLLKVLTIQRCPKLKEIIGQTSNEWQHTIVWPMLEKLKTDSTTLLKILPSKRLSIQQTNGNEQPQSTIKEVIPKLEELELQSVGDMDQFPPDLFHHLKLFKVNGSGSHGGSSILTSLRRFYNLESLEFFHFDFKDEVPCKGEAGTLPRIRNLKLTFSKNLKGIWKKDSELGHVISNLTTLELSFCREMTNIVTPSQIQNLVQLTTLKIKGCGAMTEIVANEGDGTTEHQPLVLHELKCLQLISLKSLTSFCSGNYSFEFPCLEELVVKECPRLKIFSQGVLSTPRLQCVKKWYFEKKGHWSGDLITTIQQLFTEQIRSDYKLEISDAFPELMEIWNGNPGEFWDFQTIRIMEFCNCSSLKYILTPSLLLSLKKLRHIKVEGCSSMEEVIKEEETTTSILIFPKLFALKIEGCSSLTSFYLGTQTLEFPKLKRIEIAECPKMIVFSSSTPTEMEKDKTAALFSDKVVFPSLKNLIITGMNCTRIWQDQLTLNSFCKLNNIRVEGCEQLLNIFPFNMVERLEELAMLLIKNCDSLQEIIGPLGIVANESRAVAAPQSIAAETVTTKFAFPKLKCLILDKLPMLRRFYSRMHTTELPSLKRIEVIECSKVQIFAPQCPSFGETLTENQADISNQQALFYVNEDTFPVLEELTVCDGHLPYECFREVKLLNLQRFHQTSTAFPSGFIDSFPNLEMLVINNASVCQIVQSEGFSNEGRHTPTAAQIKELRLSKLPELTHLQPGAALCYLRILIVLECGKLKTLEPSLLSFKNLTTLEVSRCHGFINLLACSTAKSLKLLENITITDCEMMEEIIACEGKEMHGGIDFPQLKYLQLSCLPTLASFSLMHHAFEFPVLLRVIVTKCPKMKNFCQGYVSTPKLQQMHLTRDEEDELRWEGDLNTTIEHMFNVMNVQNSEVTEVTHQPSKLE